MAWRTFEMIIENWRTTLIFEDMHTSVKRKYNFASRKTEDGNGTNFYLTEDGNRKTEENFPDGRRKPEDGKRKSTEDGKRKTEYGIPLNTDAYQTS
ncbi:hypothetical protein B9Z55_028330 [Caenorhabditis nigoni]|uniref:Uncharacterized protein n=1 Tax=Caenorhabditis nigoni TaxID=1611254 RepID=A0A2G5SBX3_9PELO|nr:hypothetical protein B9Z55_028330 [Caenorhabditis nigoni]